MTANARADELVELAAVVRAHGLAGEVLLKVFNPESELLAGLSEVQLRTADGQTRAYRVRSVRGGSDTTIVALEGVGDRDSAEALRGQLVCVPRSALPPLEEGEYYLIDLVGLDVKSASGEVIGRVEDVIEYPSVQCLLVCTGEQWREVPDLPRYVLEVHVAAGYVVVDNLDELDTVSAPASDRR